MTDETQKAEELLQSSSQQRRHDTDPTDSEPEPDLKDAMKRALAEIDNGDRHSNVTFRDDAYAALFAALEETDSVRELSELALEALGQDQANGKPETKATAVKLLVKLGLSEVRPELLETFEEADREYAQESDDYGL